MFGLNNQDLLPCCLPFPKNFCFWCFFGFQPKFLFSTLQSFKQILQLNDKINLHYKMCYYYLVEEVNLVLQPAFINMQTWKMQSKLQYRISTGNHKKNFILACDSLLQLLLCKWIEFKFISTAFWKMKQEKFLCLQCSSSQLPLIASKYIWHRKWWLLTSKSNTCIWKIYAITVVHISTLVTYIKLHFTDNLKRDFEKTYNLIY